MSGASPVEVELEVYGGGVSGSEEKDGCGRWARGHLTLMRLGTEQGTFWIPYHGLCGIDELADGFNLHFRATLTWEHDGEVGPMEGCWEASVKGKNLASVLMHIGAHQRAELHKGGLPHGDRPCVTSIRLRPVEPAVYEAPR